MQLPDGTSQYSPRLHAWRHLPVDPRTGRLTGHDAHWSNRGPVQVAQSGWQGEHVPPVAGVVVDAVLLLDVTAVARENVFAGQDAMQEPFRANWPLWEQVRQKVGEPAQLAQEESQAIDAKSARRDCEKERMWANLDKSGRRCPRSGSPGTSQHNCYSKGKDQVSRSCTSPGIR